MPPSKTASTDKPSRPRLTRARVLDGAVALADRIGMESFTIRNLAAELDTKPMTIYHHIPNKEAIIDGMVDRVFAEIDHPPAEVDWKTAIAHRARAARAVLARHPWATPLMESRSQPWPGDPGPPRRRARLPPIGGLLRRDDGPRLRPR